MSKPNFEVPEKYVVKGDDLHADLIGYIGERPHVHEDAINLPYSAGHIHKCVSGLVKGGKLKRDESGRLLVV